MSNDGHCECEYCGDSRGMCDMPHPRDDRFFSMKLDENGDMYLPCHARRYVLERLGFEDHERIETRSAKLRTIHGHTFVIQVFNPVFQTEFGCPKWEDLCTHMDFRREWKSPSIFVLKIICQATSTFGWLSICFLFYLHVSSSTIFVK